MYIGNDGNGGGNEAFFFFPNILLPNCMYVSTEQDSMYSINLQHNIILYRV